MRGVMRFRKNGKLSPGFIGPFEIPQRMGRLAYRVALPPDLVGTHDVFHVSMLRKYIANPDVVVEYDPLEIQEGLIYTEEPVKIMDRKEEALRTKTVPIIKLTKKEFAFLYRVMTPMRVDPNCMSNYSFCELIDLGVEIDED
ncbi:uncharacterized protein LOC132181840 [Corylus avellana]|uniref:uncharacterized protein LOC132181840 n=1 Tax=Corylus avellana TaxID=13451 RepID=UPI00286CC078|nr:uncharacterized protein LOC132181840 [Corylus avellana]